jgi:hypothetical protein
MGLSIQTQGVDFDGLGIGSRSDDLPRQRTGVMPPAHDLHPVDDHVINAFGFAVDTENRCRREYSDGSPRS